MLLWSVALATQNLLKKENDSGLWFGKVANHGGLGKSQTMVAAYVTNGHKYSVLHSKFLKR
jgi:hypothetical protein